MNTSLAVSFHETVYDFSWNFNPARLRFPSFSAILSGGKFVFSSKGRREAQKTRVWGGEVMLPWVRGLCAVILVVFVSGCATKAPVPYDRASAGDIKTIGLLSPQFPKQPTAYVAATIGQSFGLVGALIDAGIQNARESRLADLLAGQQFAAEKTFTDGLVAAVRARGYEVKMLPVERPNRTEFLEKYPAASETRVDAYLDVLPLNYGYMAAGMQASAPYRPLMVVGAQLVRARDGSVLMQDAVIYNPLNGGGQAVTLSPDPAYAFPDFETLTANPAKVTEGLNVAFEQTVDAVGNLLH